MARRDQKDIIAMAREEAAAAERERLTKQMQQMMDTYSAGIKQIVREQTKLLAPKASSLGKYNLEQILKYLSDPANNETNLQKASRALYNLSPHYRRLVDYFANLLTWSYIVTPLNYDDTKSTQNKAFARNYRKAVGFCERLNVQNTMFTIMLDVVREGIYFGVLWERRESVHIQKFSPENCKIQYISEGAYSFAYDMSKVSESTLNAYPPQFADMLAAYKAGANKWQVVPEEIAVCLKADFSNVEYAIPMFAAAMVELFNIQDARTLQNVSSILRNYKMLAGKIPVDGDGNPVIPKKLIDEYYNAIKNVVGDRIGIAFTPFDLEAIEFQKQDDGFEQGAIKTAVNNFWQSAGTSGLLHGMSDKTTGTTKLALKNDEALLLPLMGQAERLINRLLGYRTTGVRFKITFLPITAYNREEYVKQYKESATYGIGKLMYCAALGIPQSELLAMASVEDMIQLDKFLKPLISSHTISGSSDNEGGRPPLKDDELSDEGEKSRDNESHED